MREGVYFRTRQEFLDAGWEEVLVWNLRKKSRGTTKAWRSPSGEIHRGIFFDENGRRIHRNGEEWTGYGDEEPSEPVEVRRLNVRLNTDPNCFDGGRFRYRAPIFADRDAVPDHIPDMKSRVAEKEGLFPYVKGKGPRPFRSFAEKNAYMKRYGFEEIGFEDEARASQ